MHGMVSCVTEVRLLSNVSPEHVVSRRRPPAPLIGAPQIGPAYAVPAALSPLIGRGAELAELGHLLDLERVVTLTGAGGSGKTRLAAEVARMLDSQFPGGVAWIELAGLTGATWVETEVAAALDIAESSPGDMIDRVVAALGSRSRTLLVLDNAEHLVASTAQLTAAVSAACANVTVLTTSREPLGVPGELVWRVPSLSAPSTAHSPQQATTAAAVLAYEAVELFAERAARTRRGFVVTDANAAAVAQICGRLDGLPLAIELAAARVRTISPERIADQLDDRFRLLTGGPRTSTARQQTLQASVEWSEALLDPAERMVFRRLGVFSAGFTIGAAEAVIGAFGDVDVYDVADIVARLVDKSLVQIDGPHDRYHYLETLRSFALQRLLEMSETAIARDAHADWCATFLDDVAAQGDAGDVNDWWHNRLAVIGRVDPEWPNCCAALEWLPASSPLALRLVAGLGDYWALRQRAGHSARYGMAVLQAGDRSDREWIRTVLQLQAVRTNAGDATYALIRDETAALAESRGDLTSARRLTISRPIATSMVSGPTNDVLADLADLRMAAAETRDWFTLWNAAQSPAVILASAGRTREAEALVEHLTGSRAVLIRAFGAQMRGEVDRSIELADEAQQLLDARLGATMDRMIIALLTASSALSTHAPEQLDTIRTGDRGGDPLPHALQATYEMVNGVRYLLADDLPEARTMFAAARPDLFPSWRTIGYLAQVELSLGNLQAAVTAAVDLRERCTMVSAPLYETTADLVLAECARADRPTEAIELAHGALETATTFELWPAAVDALETLAVLLTEVDRDRDATRLLAAAQTARRSMQYRYRFAHRRAALQPLITRMADSEDWRSGTALALPDAVELARRMRGTRLRPTAGWESLTPTELVVAEHAADGLSNPQIAERLLMSRATVKTHLLHVFAKLAINNRTELATLVVSRRAGS